MGNKKNDELDKIKERKKEENVKKSPSNIK